MQKKSIQIFSNCKNKHAKKKHEITFQKKMQKKGINAKKKDAKKAGAVYAFFMIRFYAFRVKMTKNRNNRISLMFISSN